MKRKTKILIQKSFVNACRLLLALTFLFSGFVKANDPYGTVYKLNDYFASMGNIHIPELVMLFMAVGIAFFEFSLGIYLFFGINRKKASTFTVIFMVLMTLLTVYIYIFNPVSDCGCFGDAIILSNGATLLKNIVLLSAAFFLKRFSKMQTEFVPDRFKWIISILSMVLILAYSSVCIYRLPIIDFRPYKIGTNLKANYESYSNPDNFEIKIVYERDGETLELDAEDDDPDDSWTYVETKREIKNEEQLETSNFFFTDSKTDDDITEDILYNEGDVILLIIPDLKHADESCIDKINDIYDFSQEEHIAMYCLTASLDEKTQKYWNEHTGAEYEYYIGDDRLLKTIVRGKPGIVLIHNGVIMNKWSNHNIPSREELKSWTKGKNTE